jgi:methionyl-tRNA formyltransferase
MRAIFMGAPAFAVPALQTLSRQAVEIVAVYTKAPRPAGRRGLEPTKTPVHAEAERLGLEVRTPPTLRKPETIEALRALDADIAIVAAYGLILSAEALAAPRLGCFNLHASLLPRWRGAAPVQRALMAGDAETGVAIMQMEVGLDTGPIAGELRTPIDPAETAEELTIRLSHLAAQTLGENWSGLVEGRLAFSAQSETGVTYAHKIDKREAPIDWSRPASEVKDHIRALSPFPGAATETPGAERLKVLRAEVVEGAGKPGEIIGKAMAIACGEGAVRALRVQRAGRNVMSGEEFMRSGALRVGDVLMGPSVA